MPAIHSRYRSPDGVVGGSKDRDPLAVWSRDDLVPVFRAAANRFGFT